MLSSVSLSGRLGHIVGTKARQVEVDRLVYSPSGGRYQVDCFLVLALSEESLLMTSPLGSLVYLKGRIEISKQYGFVIVDELDEIFTMPKGLKKSMESEQIPEATVALASEDEAC